MIVAVDTTVSLSYIIDILNDFPPPIVAEEIPPRDKFRERTQTFGGLLQLLPSAVDSYHLSGGSASSLAFKAREVEPAAFVPKRDPWLEVTTKAIAAHRGLSEGWDNAVAAVPTGEALDTAELLALGFTALPMNQRPQFIVDTEGNPSYTIYNDDVYLHLTIEGANTVSWFKTANGVEVFEDDVVVSAENARDIAERIMSAPA